MYEEFKKSLESNEKILHFSKAYVSKVAKQPIRTLLGILVFGMFWYVILSFKKIDIDTSYLIIFAVLLLLTILFSYSIIYNIFLKYKNKDNEYFVTNKKIAVYNKKLGFITRKISEIEFIGISKEKDDYANLTFQFKSDSLVKAIKSSITFEGVKEPRNIINNIISENNYIRIYDDRPTIMGSKI